MPTVLLLGATSDMGIALAEEFAKHKYDVQLAGRNVEHLHPLQSDLAIRFGITATVHHFDALDITSHQTFYNELSVKPDVTISVVGYMKDNELVIASPDEITKTIVTNYSGPVSILNIVAADYTAKAAGVIVGISSVAGMRGRQSNYIYGSAKAAFTAYLSGLRNKLYEKKVHVVTVLPGFVNTKMTAELKLPKILTAQPSDVAKAIYKGVEKKKNIIYVKWFWRWIMLIITSIPEGMFKKKKL